MLQKVLAGAVLALALSACAATTYTPVAMVQAGDDDLTCAAIDQQITDNKTAQAAFEKKDHNVANGNVAKGVAGAIPYVGIVAIANANLSNEEQAKARALADRSEHLEYLKKQKGCAT